MTTAEVFIVMDLFWNKEDAIMVSSHRAMSIPGTRAHLFVPILVQQMNMSAKSQSGGLLCRPAVDIYEGAGLSVFNNGQKILTELDFVSMDSNDSNQSSLEQQRFHMGSAFFV